MKPECPTYQPHVLLDSLKKHLGARSDKELALMLGYNAPAISKMRHGKQELTPAAMVFISEATGWNTKIIRELYRLQLNRGEK